MLNDKLIEIRTPLYRDAGTITLSMFMRDALMDFEARIVTLFNSANTPDGKCVDIKEALYTVRFHDMFTNAGYWLRLRKTPTYRFKINPKNINFKTTISNLQQEFKEAVISGGVNLDVQMANNPTEQHIKSLQEIPDWENLFGKGEFPYLNIYVFRLGNTEYFCYSIAR